MQFKSILLLALVAAAAASKDDKSFLRTIKDKLCPDGKQRCLNDEPCCAFTPGSDGCCSSDESCCADDQGASCCIIQPTYCVPKNANLNPYPARCCPRYTVGCNVGEVGCCDPAIPWQRRHRYARRSPLISIYKSFPKLLLSRISFIREAPLLFLMMIYLVSKNRVTERCQKVFMKRKGKKSPN